MARAAMGNVPQLPHEPLVIRAHFSVDAAITKLTNT